MNGYAISGRPATQEEIARFAQKAVNAAGSLRRFANAIAHKQAVIVPTEEQERRTLICVSCEFYTGKTCRKCGCFIRFKAKLQTEHCPIGKW